MTRVTAEFLRSFCAAASEGSVSAAARRLGLGQPAVSRHLLLLQEAYGAPLYERRARGIALTPAGRALLPYACDVGTALERAHRFLDGEVEAGVTRLRVGLSHHLTTRYTGALLRAAKLYNAGGNLLRLHLLEAYSDDLLRAVQRGDLDVAYTLGEPGGGGAAADVRSARVGEERVMLLVKDDDPLGAQPLLPLDALEGETVVVPSSASWLYRLVLRSLDGAGVRPGRLLEISGPAAVRSAILDGLGIGVTVESFVRPEVASGALRLVAADAADAVAEVRRITRHERHLAPEGREALAFLAARLGEPAPGGAGDPMPGYREIR